jgi:hypothetical protein
MFSVHQLSYCLTSAFSAGVPWAVSRLVLHLPSDRRGAHPFFFFGADGFARRGVAVDYVGGLGVV